MRSLLLLFINKLTQQFCDKVPVAADFDLSQYTGTWYQTYANAAALRFSAGNCVTANYTLKSDGTVAVLNCAQRSQSPPTCGVAVASKRRPEPGYLQVKFAGFPAGPYNVAAVLGDKQYGYYAAAVYSCSVIPGRPVEEQWYILMRKPYQAERALHQLGRKLACKGYNMYRGKLFKTNQGQGCDYFNGPKGFQLMAPRGPRPPSGNGGPPGGRPINM